MTAMQSTSMVGDDPSGRRGSVLDVIGGVGANDVDSAMHATAAAKLLVVGMPRWRRCPQGREHAGGRSRHGGSRKWAGPP
ncbi:hypothetical protein GUJ93_ZPchr0010g7782 [Zizania palustris]|uniref:Uncharacterized protein n=1 Tax=Zizania palustris TaxID=103762 RepID=A0A8J5W781_ZIZPA|nr:hypothetical protein GUJ93_ZPchr0010g7782 [Zizania palustris]